MNTNFKDRQVGCPKRKHVPDGGKTIPEGRRANWRNLLPGLRQLRGRLDILDDGLMKDDSQDVKEEKLNHHWIGIL